MYRALLILITLSVGCGPFSLEPPEEVPLENNFMPGRWLFRVETKPLFASEDKYVDCYLEIRKDEDRLTAEAEDCELINNISLKGMVQEGNRFFLRSPDGYLKYYILGDYGDDGTQAFGSIQFWDDLVLNHQVWKYEYFAERIE